MHDLYNLSNYNAHFASDGDFFFDFPVNIWVATFVVYAFHGSTFVQSGVFGNVQYIL